MIPKSSYPPLFEYTEGSHMTACLNFKHDMSTGYTEGYLRAANHLITDIEMTNRNQDFFVYPIAFMYRQHIELQLKTIIKQSNLLLNDNNKCPKNHKLVVLWQNTKGLLREIYKIKPEPKDFKLVDHFVDEFTKIDPDSTGFRYPKQKDDSTSLRGIRHINLKHLAECINSLSSFLDSAITQINIDLEEKYKAQYHSSKKE